jgi:hypothetical protein
MLELGHETGQMHRDVGAVAGDRLWDVGSGHCGRSPAGRGGRFADRRSDRCSSSG